MGLGGGPNRKFSVFMLRRLGGDGCVEMDGAEGGITHEGRGGRGRGRELGLRASGRLQGRDFRGPFWIQFGESEGAEKAKRRLILRWVEGKRVVGKRVEELRRKFLLLFLARERNCRPSRAL